jgi:asparagine synthase (glutamine-hydrolysing)
MPGLSFICNFTENLKQKEAQLTHSLRSLVHSELYKSKVLYYDKSYFLGISGYDEYPFYILDNNEYFIVVEGKVYGKSQSLLDRELQNLANSIFHKANNYKKELLNWLLGTDGDFVITIMEKHSGESVVFNDALGRLPTYYYEAPHGLIISREVRFIINLLDHNRFDRMGIAQCLLFGYPLANRTLFENVHRLPPAAVLRIVTKQPRIEFDSLYTFNFDEKKYKTLSLKDNTDNLYALFLEAVKNRTNSIDKNIIALSGGLDSRSVALAFHVLGIPFSGATYLDAENRKIDDVKIAEQLSNSLHLPWRLFHLDMPTEKESTELLKTKNGMIFLGMSFILKFFKAIKEFYGNRVIYFTGDGGDKTLPDLSPNRSISNVDKLLDFIIKNNQIFSLDEASSLSNLGKNQIMSEIKNVVMAYPEKQWQNKYVHFLLFERGFKWMFEGEDKNRCYFWSIAPFYSLPFFIYAMNCPESLKRRYKLYQRFMMKLSPEASLIPKAKWRFPITSDFKLFLFTSIYLRLPLRLKGIFRNALKKRNITNPIAKDRIIDLEKQTKRCSYISNYLSIAELRNIESIDSYKLDILNTITSVIEEFAYRE